MKKREEMNEEYFWDLSAIYKNDSEITKDMEEARVLCDKIAACKGNIMDSSDSFYNVLDLQTSLGRTLNKLYVYNHLCVDQDQTNSKNLDEFNKIYAFIVKLSSELSFIEPEILETEKSVILEYMKSNSKLNEYERSINKLLKDKKYVLSDIEENILSKTSMLSSAPNDIFSALVDTDIVFEDVVDSNGEKHALNESAWFSLISSTDRVLRENAFSEFYRVYGMYNNTLTSIFLNELKSKDFYINVRGYDDPLQKALSKTEVDPQIYYNLVETVRDNLEINHKYMSLRKDVLGYDELYLYDTYVPMIMGEEKKYSFLEAKELVINSLAILGEDYLNVVKTSFDQKWIDVYPNKGKRGGAYSSGCYDTYPYILLNYTDTLNDVFTLAHEMGHSMHSYLSRKHQAPQNANYKIFVAEIASTVNELLLMDYMLENSDDVEIKKYLINHNLEQFRSTVFRQTMFAEFELKANEEYFASKTVSSDWLNELYLQINKDYFGPSVTYDNNVMYEWSRIPHFYYDFYVYQYATSFCISTYIAKQIKAGNEELKSNYLKFLSSGDIVDPVSLVSIIGIDICTKDILEFAMKEYQIVLENMQNLLNSDIK